MRCSRPWAGRPASTSRWRSTMPASSNGIGVRVLGTPLAAVRAAEDRGGFRDLVTRIGEPVPESAVVETVERRDALRRGAAARRSSSGRPSRSAGGGGGFALDAGRGTRADRSRPGGQPHRPGARRAQPARLERDRVRGPARRHRHRRSPSAAWRTSTRWGSTPATRSWSRRSRPCPIRSSSAAPLRPEDRARPEARGRLQRPAGRLARHRRLPRHRGQPAGQPLVGAGLQGDRLPDRARRGAHRASGSVWTSCRTPPPAATSPRSSRRSTTWSSSCRAGRSTSSRPPTARWASR